MMSKYFLLTIIIMAVLCLSCERDPVSYPEPTLSTYYLRYEEALDPEPGPSNGWLYITNFIYPVDNQLSTCSWQTQLNNNITGSEYGCDVIFWTASDAKVKIEYILDHQGKESILASKEFNIPYISDSTGIQVHCEVGEKSAIKGKNPLSGRGDNLIFKIKHIEGPERVSVFYDADIGMFGNSSISFYTDR